MNIGDWLKNILTTDSTVSGIVGDNVRPDKGEYANIPLLVYSILSSGHNLILRTPIINIKGIQTTRGKMVTLMEAVRALFDDTSQSLKEVFSNINIIGVTIVNFNEATWDEVNQLWMGNIDIRTDYIN